MNVINKPINGVTICTRACACKTVAIPWKAQNETSKDTAGFSAVEGLILVMAGTPEVLNTISTAKVQQWFGEVTVRKLLQ